MTGMDVVIDLRRSGMKPQAVFVDLCRDAPRDDYAMSNSGIVTVNIANSDSLADIDFRPLVGLQVHISDFDSDPLRLRRAAAMLAEINPSHLVMTEWSGDTMTIHQRWAGDPARTETFRA